jgi:hypothetical protein
MADPPTLSWTTEQLHRLKKAPYLSKSDSLTERIAMRRKNIIFDCGGVTAFIRSTLLEVNDSRVAWITRDGNGDQVLNLDIRHEDGRPLFRMEENDWIAFGPFQDLETPPSATEIRVSTLNQVVSFNVQFENVEFERFANRFAKRIGKLLERQIAVKPYDPFPSLTRMRLYTKRLGISWPAQVITLRGRLAYPCSVDMKETSFEVQNGSLRTQFSGSLLGGGISLKPGQLGIAY